MRTFFFLLLPQVIDFPCSRLYLIQRLPFSIILDLKQSLVFDTATTSVNHPRPQAVACIRYSDYFSQSSSTSSSRLYSIQRLLLSIILDLKQSLVFDTATTSITDLRHHGLDFASALPVSSFLSPNISTNLTNFGLGNGLVKISDTLLSVGMYFTSILPSSTASRIK